MKAVFAGVRQVAGPLALVGAHEAHLQRGGDELFVRMHEAIAAARHDIWLATYIFHNDTTAQAMAEALALAARRGVQVRVVVDGFGSKASLSDLRQWWAGSGVSLAVFRPLDRWWRYFQPSQLRRLHQKLCVVDAHTAFVGGINIIDDRNDLHHGATESPRLDFAVMLQGPLVERVQGTAAAIWQRAHLGQTWRGELLGIAQAAAPLDEARRVWRGLRSAPASAADAQAQAQASAPVRAAFVVRDNFLQRRAIERTYIEALRGARKRIDIACPYFYPGRAFRRALSSAAVRGVEIRLLLQGKLDYRIAGLAAQVMYEELLRHRVRIFEYTPAFLHAKVAVVDEDWATVGSSNIDPLSLLLNLEANLVLRDAPFAQTLRAEFETAVAQSHEVRSEAEGRGWRHWISRGLARGLVAWLASAYLRLAGVNGPY